MGRRLLAEYTVRRRSVVTFCKNAYETAAGPSHTHNLVEAWTGVRAWIRFIVDPTKENDPGGAPFEGLHLAELGTLGMLVVSVLRGLRAFGLNPGALLATAAGSIKLRDLDAQTSFREKFRAE